MCLKSETLEKECAIFTARLLKDYIGERCHQTYHFSHTGAFLICLGWLSFLKKLVWLILNVRVSKLFTFETIEDLENSNDIMKQYLGYDVVKRWIKNSNNYQEIMLGYSDSNKMVVTCLQVGPLQSSK